MKGKHTAEQIKKRKSTGHPFDCFLCGYRMKVEWVCDYPFLSCPNCEATSPTTKEEVEEHG